MRPACQAQSLVSSNPSFSIAKDLVGEGKCILNTEREIMSPMLEMSRSCSFSDNMFEHRLSTIDSM